MITVIKLLFLERLQVCKMHDKVNFHFIMQANYFANVDLSVPTNITATVLTPYSVKVNWNQTSDATGYCISYNSTASSSNVTVNDGNATSHTFNNLEQNTQYTITVQATGSDNRMSAKSNDVPVKTSADGKKYIYTKVNVKENVIMYITPQFLSYHHITFK